MTALENNAESFGFGGAQANDYFSKSEVAEVSFQRSRPMKFQNWKLIYKQVAGGSLENFLYWLGSTQSHPDFDLLSLRIPQMAVIYASTTIIMRTPFTIDSGIRQRVLGMGQCSSLDQQSRFLLLG